MSLLWILAQLTGYGPAALNLHTDQLVTSGWRQSLTSLASIQAIENRLEKAKKMMDSQKNS